MTDLVLLALDESPTRQLLARALRAVGYGIVSAEDRAGVKEVLAESHPALLILAASLAGKDGVELIEDLLLQYPTLPIIFLATESSLTLIQKVLSAGVSAYLEPPLNTDQIVDAVKSSLSRAKRLGDWLRREVKTSTASLEKRVSELNVLLEQGRNLTSSLELGEVLNNVVKAAVKLTNAEEGSLLLLDDESGELYMRAGHNFEKGFMETFRLPVQDTLAGQVIRTGEMLSFNKDSLYKIQTAYLVQSLVYVPLKLKDRIIGVLGVDNRKYQHFFSERDALLLSLLADYAAIAIENASLYQTSDEERSKFEAVFSNMDDALLILDAQERIQLINQSMCSALGISAEEAQNQIFTDVVAQGDMLDLLKRKNEKSLRYHEVNLDDDRIFSAQYTPIPSVGAVITMQDISYLKELNRIKDDFVHTVSHDLRSPLTSVLGYSELLERVGPLSEQQIQFVDRMRSSVRDITVLIDNLLDLGRIEAGFDMHREVIHIDSILRYTLSNLEPSYQKKKQILEVDITSDLPALHGNPMRLRQMFDNLIGNAIKYTPEGKRVCVKLGARENEIIIQISDQGPGIPLEDQPHIFEKFYRAGNIIANELGTGLGLAIVKTIVESHRGRIWVESKLGEGSSFFVLLPLN